MSFDPDNMSHEQIVEYRLEKIEQYLLLLVVMLRDKLDSTITIEDIEQ